MLSPGREPRSAARATHSLETHGSSSRSWPARPARSHFSTSSSSSWLISSLFFTYRRLLIYFFSLFLSLRLLFLLNQALRDTLQQRRCMAGCARRMKGTIPSRTRVAALLVLRMTLVWELLPRRSSRFSSRAKVRERAGGQNGRKLT